MKILKSTLKLLLLMSLCGIMLFVAACGEEPTTETPNTPVAPEAPATSVHDAPDGTFIGVMDMTESYTLVPSICGMDEMDRKGKSCAEGMVQVASYSADGLVREKFYQLAWEDLGLEGAPWQYLGSTFELDITGDAPTLKNTPEITTFHGGHADLSFPTVDTISFKEKTYDIASLDYGYMRKDNLIEEGGWYLPAWDNKEMKDSNARVWRVKDGHYLFISVPLYSKTLVVVTNSSFSTNYGLQNVAVIGDYILGLNNMSLFLNEMAGLDNYYIYSEAYFTEPGGPYKRLEFYELFKYDDNNNCIGWQTGSERVQRLIGFIDQCSDLDYLIVNTSRRDTLYLPNMEAKAISAMKWLSETYADTQIFAVVDAPYPDSTMNVLGFKGSGSTASEHYNNIYAFAKKMTDGLENVTLVNVGAAFNKALKEGLQLYGDSGNYVSHPNVKGTYVVSCMLYSAISGEKSLGTFVPDEINADEAAQLQQLADSVSFESGPIL